MSNFTYFLIDYKFGNPPGYTPESEDKPMLIQLNVIQYSLISSYGGGKVIYKVITIIQYIKVNYC